MWNFQSQLAVVVKAVYKLWKDNSTLSQTLEIWLDVSESFELSFYGNQIKHRLEQAVTPFHYFANMMQIKKFLLKILNPVFPTSIKMLQIQNSDYYPATMFTEKVTESFEAKKKGGGDW